MADVGQAKFCFQCGSRTEVGDLRCAICGTAVEVAGAQTQQQRFNILRCDSCAAAVCYDVQAQSPRCGFCDSTVHVETVTDPPEETEFHLPFIIDRETARTGVKAWLGRLGFFRPSDLVSSSRLDTVVGLYWVAWVFDVDALVSWTADSNHGSGRSSWAPHSGQFQITFDDVLVSASRGLSEKETAEITDGYVIASVVHDAPHPGGDATLEQFDVPRSEARANISSVISGMAAQRTRAGQIPGSRFRKVNTETVLRQLHTRRFALPAYVMAYRYRDKLYRVVMSGQNDACLVGSAPYSPWKILGVSLLCLSVIGGVIALLAS